MKNELLPIGSVVKANGNDIMICAYVNKGTKIKGESYDYACCLYPFGLTEKAILIKKNQIERIIFLGYRDNRFEKIKEAMEKLK